MAALDVYMNGYRVGLFSKSPAGAHYFQYDAPWLALARSRPISLLTLLHNAHPANEKSRKLWLPPLFSRGVQGEDLFDAFSAIYLADRPKSCIRDRSRSVSPSHGS